MQEGGTGSFKWRVGDGERMEQRACLCSAPGGHGVDLDKVGCSLPYPGFLCACHTCAAAYLTLTLASFVPVTHVLQPTSPSLPMCLSHMRLPICLSHKWLQTGNCLLSSRPHRGGAVTSKFPPPNPPPVTGHICPRAPQRLRLIPGRDDL